MWGLPGGYYSYRKIISAWITGSKQKPAESDDRTASSPILLGPFVLEIKPGGRKFEEISATVYFPGCLSPL
jgi:hypothetical protein